MTPDPFAIVGMPALPQAQRSALREVYRHPPRAYHDFGHVGEVMRHFVAVAQGPGWTRPLEVWLAVLYHDAVYDPARRDNEERSAQLALEHLARWPLDADAEWVAALIRLTARHGQHAPGDFGDGEDAADTRHFLDCDMAILGAAPADFDAYDRAIAAEYRGHVPGWLFRLNRRRFLKKLLASERIFLSDFFHARCDTQARDNLRRTVTARR